MLHKLSDQELIFKTKTLVNNERELLVEILNHLKEIDFRKLYLDLGFSSLWAYCTEELGYSEASAHRRIEAMRAIRELPVLEQKIENGTLSISNIAKAQSLLRRVEKTNTSKISETLDQRLDHKLNLFMELENKSQKLADVILASRFPEQVIIQEKVRVITETVSEIKLAAKKELLDKLDRVKKLVAHKNPNPTYAEVIELMADFVIAKKDPLVKKTKVDESNKVVKSTHLVKSNMAAESNKSTQTNELANPKKVNQESLKNQPPQRKWSNHQRQYIPKSIQRDVWHKAKGSCEFISPISGKRCNSEHMLEIDHKQPIAFGGCNNPENLRLLCRAHNMHTAKQATL